MIATFLYLSVVVAHPVPVIPFAELKFYVLVRDRVQGFELDPLWPDRCCMDAGDG